MKRIAFALVLFVSIDLSAKRPPSLGISLAPSAWQVRYSQGVRLSALNGMAGWFFDVPKAPGHVNYITTHYTQPMTQVQSMTFTAQVVVVNGSPVFLPTPDPDNTCNYPAHVRAYLEQVDAFGAGGDTYRWWSNPIAMQLSQGVATVSTPIDPSQWSDVNGQFGVDEPNGWADALAHPAAVGLTFGAACFYGHGIYVSGGTAQFVLTGFAIQ